MRSNFFGGINDKERKIAWVKWDEIIAAKEDGGIGVGSLESLNQALLYRWRWRALCQPASLWSKVVSEIHGVECFTNLNAKNAGLWSRIASSIRSINKVSFEGKDCMKRVVGNGNNTSFWKDSWCSSKSLAVQFPRLASLDIDINCRVSDRRMNNAWSWCWRRPISNPRVSKLLEDLMAILPNSFQIEETDKWTWDLDGQGEFTVAGLRKRIDHVRAGGSSNKLKTIWNNLVPKKINVFIWRLRKNAIPTRVNLFAKGVDVDTFSCPRCRSGVETIYHLFHRCKCFEDMRLLMNNWLQLIIPSGSIEETIRWCDKLKVHKHTRNTIQAILFVWWWYSWKLRNEKIYQNLEESTWDSFRKIVTISYGWIHNRSKKFGTPWDVWRSYPL